MVNIAGRSKGCSTCRRRRVKCDETRPICLRCQRGGLECDGAKDITFVQGTIVKSRRSDKRTSEEVESLGGTRSSLSPSPPRTLDFETYVCYIRKHLSGGLVDIALNDLQLSDIDRAGNTPANGQLFPQAVLSFAMIFFGTHNSQSSIVDQGYAMHGVALKHLNQQLSDPRCYVRDEVILAVVTLALSECYVPTGPQHYLKHMLGLERLLDLRDPMAQLTPQSSEIYKCVRHMILFASLYLGTPSILAKPAWKTVLRFDCTPEELTEQDLFDILADFTILAAARNKMLKSWGLDPDKDAYERDEIKGRTLTLLSTLCAWKSQWNNDRRNIRRETSAAFTLLQAEGFKGEAMEAPFLTIFEFASDFAASMSIYYNTLLMYILRLLASLTNDNLGTPSNQTPTGIPLYDFEYLGEIWKDTKDVYVTAQKAIALEICRSVPYFLVRKGKRLKSSYLQVFYLAAMAAFTTLGGNDSTEGRWMTDLLHKQGQEVMATGIWSMTQSDAAEVPA